MQYIPYFFVLICIGIVLLVIRSWLNKVEERSKLSEDLVSWLKEMGTRLDSQNSNIDQKLMSQMKVFNERLDRASETMQHVQKSIGEFSEIGRSMQQLQEFLQSPKLRGNIGEQVLKELLNQCLPPDCFTLQYGFKNGEKVDAVIKTVNGLIPIDSKFPMSNFKRMIEEQDAKMKEQVQKEFIKDVRTHIKSISQKYILTSEGTIDYAIMYIPSESIYYEIINTSDLYDFAAEKRIVPVSPMSFYAYLKVILLSFEGQRIQKQAKDIIQILQSMRKDYEKADEAMGVLHKHLSNAYNQSAQVSQSLMKLGQKIESTSSISSSPVQEKLIE
jgi:DNA recombination protein RmuC